MAYATYNFYKNTFLGAEINEADFNRLASRAGEYIDSMTFNKARFYTDKYNDLAKCCCAIAEFIQTEEKQTGKTSESVGSWSVSYESKKDATVQKYNILKQYLWYTGLLYCRMGC